MSPRQTAADGKARLPLEGVRIVDFCWIGAGSYTTKILADMGADVIKMESSVYLDSLRKAPPFKDGVAGVNRSGYFADRNSSKRSFTMDMKHPDAREAALKMLASADVVTNNFTPGVMERFGLSYAEVKKVRPDIVYVAMSMQGQDGPEANYLGYGLTIGALTGLQALCGQPGREPAGTGTNYPDHIPNPSHAAFAILAALRHRRRTGQGQMLDMAQTEPMIAMLGTAVTAAADGVSLPSQTGNRHRDGVVQGVYPVAGADRWIAVSIEDQQRWQAFDAALGGFGSNWATQAQRLAHQDALDIVIGDRTRDLDGMVLLAQLQAAGVTSGLVQTAADVISDPQLMSRNHWQRIRHAEAGDMLYNAPSYRFSAVPSDLRGPAPDLGQHTDEIAADILGLTPEGIAQARAAKLLN